MGVFYETIPSSLQSWILEQKVIWVASAPLSASGHVNVSPKGGQYFGILDERTFWYMDLTGSGIETTSHLYEPGNGRITILFNAFEGAPKIVRLWGTGTVHENGTPFFNDFVTRHSVDTIPGSRSIVIVDIHQVGSSCGFSMPYFDFKSYRSTLNDFFAKRAAAEEAGKRKEGIEHYWASKNAQSMDGLPAMRKGLEVAKLENVPPIKKMVGPYAALANSKTAPSGGTFKSLGAVAILSFFLGLLVAAYGPLLCARLVEDIGPLIPDDALRALHLWLGKPDQNTPALNLPYFST